VLGLMWVRGRRRNFGICTPYLRALRSSSENPEQRYGGIDMQMVVARSISIWSEG